jgi:lipoate-protein ligase A
LPGISDFASKAIDERELENAIVHELSAATGWTIEPNDWTATERENAANTEREKYATMEWNAKR